MEFHIFGQVRARIDNVDIELGPTKNRNLLGVLLFDAPRPVRASRLLEMLWEDEQPAQARETLQSNISKLRRKLGNAVAGVGIEYEKPTDSYRVDVAPESVDYHRFRSLVAQARERNGNNQASEAARLFEMAIALWTQPLLAEIGTSAFRRVRETNAGNVLLPAYSELCKIHLDGQRPGLALDLLEEIQPDYPTNEMLAEHRLRALHAVGRTNEISTYFKDFQRALLADNGAEPGLQLAATYAELASRSVASTPRPRATPQPHGFPRTSRQLAGRSAMLSNLDKLFLAEDAASPIIVTLDGQPGVGKTTLACYWASSRQQHFPDGQIYCALNSSEVPGDAGLRALNQIRDYTGAQAGDEAATVYDLIGAIKDALHDKRMLIVLDNARDAAQLAPLIEACHACSMLIISRNQLTALRHDEDAVRCEVPELPTLDARALLQRECANLDDISADRLIEFCHGLPLALRLAAFYLTSRPRVPARELIDDLVHYPSKFLDADSHLTGTTTMRRSYAAALSVLPDTTQQAFRLLGLHPSAWISIDAAAALLGRSRPDANRELDVLAHSSLLCQERVNAYRLHDLLYLYARDVAEQLSTRDRDAANRRMFTWYVRTAHAAADILSATPGFMPELVDDLGVEPRHFAQPDEVMEWFRRERNNLLAVVRAGEDRGFLDHTWRLVVGLREGLDRCDNLREVVAIHLIAARCAHAIGDLDSEGGMLGNLAQLRYRLHEFDDALDCARRALAIFEQLNDETSYVVAVHNVAAIELELGDIGSAITTLTGNLPRIECLDRPDHLAATHHRLGVAHARIEQYTVAMQHLHLALGIRKSIKDTRNEALSYTELGRIHLAIGRNDRAIEYCDLALARYAEADDTLNAAETHLLRANGSYRTRQFSDTQNAILRALPGLRTLGHVRHLADALVLLADSSCALGRPEDALAAWDEAIPLFVGLGLPHAEEIQSRRDAVAALIAVPTAQRTEPPSTRECPGLTTQDPRIGPL